MTKWVDGIGNSSLWNPLHRHAKKRERIHPQEILLSWLILSFPEVRWVFFKSSPDNANKNKDPGNHATSESTNQGVFNPLEDVHCLPVSLQFDVHRRYPGFVPLFDPTGIRYRLRKIVRDREDREGKKIAAEIPIRVQTAAAIDEEPVYAYMNAYIAYRFGYRSWALVDWQMTENVFGNDGHGANLVLEDLYLNFADRPLDFNEENKYSKCIKKEENAPSPHLSHLEFRDCLLPKLKNVKERFLITVGHQKWQEDRHRWRLNKFYLRSLVSTRTKTLFKPFSGIYDLWKKSGKWQKFRRLPRLAEHYEWPPRHFGSMVKGPQHRSACLWPTAPRPGPKYIEKSRNRPRSDSCGSIGAGRQRAFGQ
ncbi:MAG: hypothetical protein Q9P14_05275 [candidate division KSB1 bacterium]|nr:hypothetical protein [candidate division KSB1 bacterium]